MLCPAIFMICSHNLDLFISKKQNIILSSINSDDTMSFSYNQNLQRYKSTIIKNTFTAGCAG